jgi:hypothetical protein
MLSQRYHELILECTASGHFFAASHVCLTAYIAVSKGMNERPSGRQLKHDKKDSLVRDTCRIDKSHLDTCFSLTHLISEQSYDGCTRLQHCACRARVRILAQHPADCRVSRAMLYAFHATCAAMQDKKPCTAQHCAEG